MRKPSSDPNKPAKLKGKNFRVGRDRGFFEVRRVDHLLLKGIYEGPGGIAEARWDLCHCKDKFRFLVSGQEWEKCLETLQPKLRLGCLLSIRRLMEDDLFLALLRTTVSRAVLGPSSSAIIRRPDKDIWHGDQGRLPTHTSTSFLTAIIDGAQQLLRRAHP